MTQVGCATLFSSSSQNVKITSNVEGAQVLVDGDDVGQTPLEIEVDRDTFKSKVVTLRHEGYRTKQFKLRKTLNSVSLFNCTSFFSWGTDALTGAMMEYSPDVYFIEMLPDGRRAAAGGSDRALLFVVALHRALLRDVAQGGGEYTRALARLLDVPERQHPLFVASLRDRLPLMLRERYPHRIHRHVLLARAATIPATPDFLTNPGLLVSGRAEAGHVSHARSLW